MLKVSVHKEDASGNVYTLLEELRITWRGKTLAVPAGFKSDGASVPRFFWRIVFPPGDAKALRAAFIHDFIYRTHPEGWRKKEADLVFRELLLEAGVPRFRAEAAYAGVKFFGASAWKGGQK